MRVRFEEIPDDGLYLESRDAGWFPSHELKRRGEVAAAVFMQRKGRRVLLNGTLAAELVLTCDRCLAEVVVPLDTRFSLDLEPGGDEADAVDAEHACSSSEMEVIYLDEPVVDLDQVLQQQVFLALPVKVVCGPSCRGICPHCGANRNEIDCSCAEEGKASPFTVLANLKK